MLCPRGSGFQMRTSLDATGESVGAPAPVGADLPSGCCSVCGCHLGDPDWHSCRSMWLSQPPSAKTPRCLRGSRLRRLASLRPQASRPLPPSCSMLCGIASSTSRRHWPRALRNSGLVCCRALRRLLRRRTVMCSRRAASRNRPTRDSATTTGQHGTPPCGWSCFGMRRVKQLRPLRLEAAYSGSPPIKCPFDEHEISALTALIPMRNTSKMLQQHNIARLPSTSGGMEPMMSQFLMQMMQATFGQFRSGPSPPTPEAGIPIKMITPGKPIVPGSQPLAIIHKPHPVPDQGSSGSEGSGAASTSQGQATPT